MWEIGLRDENPLPRVIYTNASQTLMEQEPPKGPFYHIGSKLGWGCLLGALYFCRFRRTQQVTYCSTGHSGHVSQWGLRTLGLSNKQAVILFLKLFLAAENGMPKHNGIFKHRVSWSTMVICAGFLCTLHNDILHV